MGIVLGVDIGGSTTKIVGVDDKELIDMLRVRAADQITSLYGGIGKFLRTHKLKTKDVEAIYLTGVGATYIDEQVYGITTHKVPEFDAIGIGALRLSGLREALVVSMGTGTAFVRATETKREHIGGTGVGGGTILGLASQLPCRRDINAILALAENGDLKNVDLLVGDILNTPISSLPPDMTASNFGKLRDIAPDSDIVLGLINMVFETIGTMALFALKNDTIDNVVLSGTLATFPQAKAIFDSVSKRTEKKFTLLPEAVFATAIGTLPAGHHHNDT